ncbi:bifunctional biotin--[acetyl-CoA-carboxylase] ligase/biotin operon repressor BirA [Methylotenera sp. G11]|uniref:bifunctional biotin--[acetyl-CoA-carboxylase] ligase/biotin operon repressor BirA n=1 Tax=Methylotenera sp. G11 TaxID=1506585 RepID=UPI000646DB56|nr:bifunctional biotin--[acetyl-CoA-carboxylase] ligase/biotin operon repressor BirA [Methylotenera sp. G11]
MNALTFPILRLLADGKFHSGEAIARHFHVSRATVWNALQYAGQLGVEIFSVPGRGYKLPQPVTLLDAQTISGALDEYGTSLHVEVHDHLASTNSYLMQNIGTARHATCVAANLQTGGRGRRGRSWHAGLGASLTFSVLWRFQCGASALSGLSLAAGIALMRSLHGLGMTGTQLKWPNDVLIGRKKLAGILIELQGDMEGPSTAVIGMGINLNLPDKLKQQIDQPVTDLASLLNGELNPNHLLAALLKHLADVLTAFEQGGFAALRDEWTQHHAYHEKDVRMLMPDGREIHGVVKGITEDGSLLVATAAGMQRFISGEISLRGT